MPDASETVEHEASDDSNRTDDTVLHNTNIQDQLKASEEVHVAAKPRKIVLTKYTIYVTNHRMYIVGSNLRESVFRIMEIDMDTSIDELAIMEDNVYFKRNEIMDVLNGLEESSEGGLTKKLTAVALLGFTKFTKCYYLVVVTKRRTVAVLGSHSVYHIDETEMIPVMHNYKTPDRNSDEMRYLQTFLNIDLNKTFYYSDSYDITNTLQTNMMRNKTQSLGLNSDKDLTKTFNYNERFVWNIALLDHVLRSFDRVYDWFQPIIHGFIDQVQISVFQTQVYVTLIARRSHHFAGARFFKRGVNEDGNVANEVETEQIVAVMLTSSFHDPAAGFYNNPRYSSFVQHRGSIPLSWSQTTAANLRIKPPIEFDMVDPYYSQSALHFDNMFKRYGSPIQILNLIKQREKTPRETKLLDAFTECVDYLNQFLPENKTLDYVAWDMSRASKARGQDVIEWLEKYSESTLNKTGVFHNGQTLEDTQLQEGICRTNCVDCLDRTNTAQFVIGKRALGHQLYALGIIKDKYLEYDSDVTNILTEMFHDHGDTIALQYGGSHLVNTLQTYRKINQWTSHSRDMIESVKRFYSNSMVDAQKQEAVNLFLGNHKYEEGKPRIWELNSDYYLHNTGSRREINYTPSYTHWFTDAYIKNRKEDIMDRWNEKRKNEFWRYLQDSKLIVDKIEPYTGFFENYWNLKYPVKDLDQMDELFEFKMNSTENYTSDNIKSLNNSVAGVVNKMGATSNTRMGNNEKKFALFNFFNDKPKLTNRDEYQIPLSRSNTESTYISASLFGSLSKTEMSELSPDIGDANSEKWFSPFKSRKPHRELKLLIDDEDSQNGSIENFNDHLLSTLKENMHINDELYVKTYINDWKDDVIAFGVLQVENQREMKEYHNAMMKLGKNVIANSSIRLPIVDYRKIEKVTEELKNKYDPIHDTSNEDDDTIDSLGFKIMDIDEKKYSLLKLYNSLDDQYMVRLPEVGTYDFGLYNDVMNVKLHGVNDSLRLTEFSAPVIGRDNENDETQDFATVIYEKHPVFPVRRTQSAITQNNGLLEIRNQWKQKRQARLQQNQAHQLLDAIYESEDDLTDQKAYSNSFVSRFDIDKLSRTYDALLKPSIDDSDIEIYKAIAHGRFDFYKENEKSPRLPQKRFESPLEEDELVSLDGDFLQNAQRHHRAQTTGALDFSLLNNTLTGNTPKSNYSFHKFNTGLKKKLSQYNIRGL